MGNLVIYRVEQDNSTRREPYGGYTYRIYEHDRIIARFWHDHRGDEYEFQFIDKSVDITDWPFGNWIEFIEGGGPEPLRISLEGVAYLLSKSKE